MNYSNLIFAMNPFNLLYILSLRIIAFTILITSAITVMSQENIQKANNKYENGDTQKTLEILQSTKEQNKPESFCN